MSLTMTVREQGEGVRNELEALRQGGARIVTFDLKDMSYLNAEGLEAILIAMKAIEARGGEVVLTNLRPQVRKVLDIIQSAPTLSIFRNMLAPHPVRGDHQPQTTRTADDASQPYERRVEQSPVELQPHP
jgi:anti-anti-sigma factor